MDPANHADPEMAEPAAAIQGSEEQLPVEEDASKYNARPACFRTTAHEVLCLAVLTVGVGQSSLSLGVCQVNTKIIGENLNMTQGEVSWINAAAALTCGAFLMFFGSTADTFGRKRQLLAGFVVFTVSALIDGFARNPLMFHTFRGVQGLAAAATIPAGIGIIGDVYTHPSPRKNKAFATFAAGNPLGFVVGCIMSGVVTQIFNWRATFYLMAIIYAAFTVVAWMVIPDDKEPIQWQSWKNLDIFGALVVTTAWILICASMTLAGTAPKGWKTPYILVFLVVGVVLLGIFIFWESKAPKPLMPLHIWNNSNFSLLMIIASFGFMNFMVTQFWLSLYFQELRHLSALMTAVWLIPQALTGVFVNIIAAYALGRIDNRFLLLIAAAAYGSSATLLATQEADTIYWAHAFPALAIAVIGADLTYNVVNMYVLSALPKAQQSTAGGIFNTTLQLAQAVGLGISTAIYNVEVTAETPSVAERMKGYTAVFWFATGIAGITFIVIPWIKVGTQGSVHVKKAPLERPETGTTPRNESETATPGTSDEKRDGLETRGTIGSEDTAVAPAEDQQKGMDGKRSGTGTISEDVGPLHSTDHSESDVTEITPLDEEV